MKVVRAVCTIAATTNLPEDNFTNTFHFKSSTATTLTGVSTAIAGRLNTFYDSIQNLYPSALTSGVVTAEFFDLADAPPRVPVATETFSFTPNTTATLMPAENAVCLSYKGFYSSGTPNAWRRGRIFVGPLTSVTGTVASSRFVVSTSTQTILANAATALAGNFAIGTDDWFWAVYSPTAEATIGSLDFATAAILDGWIDNAFDTQRRRGTKSTFRQTWT